MDSTLVTPEKLPRSSIDYESESESSDDDFQPRSDTESDNEDTDTPQPLKRFVQRGQQQTDMATSRTKLKENNHNKDASKSKPNEPSGMRTLHKQPSAAEKYPPVKRPSAK